MPTSATARPVCRSTVALRRGYVGSISAYTSVVTDMTSADVHPSSELAHERCPGARSRGLSCPRASTDLSPSFLLSLPYHPNVHTLHSIVSGLVRSGLSLGVGWLDVQCTVAEKYPKESTVLSPRIHRYERQLLYEIHMHHATCRYSPLSLHPPAGAA